MSKEHLRRYLQLGRDNLLWKLEGLSEYDARRPIVPTGTNLLGLVKHVASVEAGYLGDTFGRRFPEPLPWFDECAETNADMWVTPDESREDIVGLYRRVWAHSDTTIEALDLDAPGRVPWWRPETADVTLHQILIHLIAETDRHGGHADILRELIDGATGWRPGKDSLAFGTAEEFAAFHATVERAAREAGRP
ncbi:DinB family protein [Dactylosporangium sp. CA-233914]|uniref:DinB family protein n=1 Tax=Dactylosporangium sp. CA-233914 TaxID=3239934 RepID=UPI003D8DD298